MRGLRVLRVMTLRLVVAGGLAAPAMAQTADEEAVRSTVELYLRSHATGDGRYVGEAFHPELTMFFVREGELRSRAGTDYVAGFSGQPSPEEASRRRWIEMVDGSGGAAVAKVILDYPAVRITDYFTLLKVDGTWKIMNKVFHSEPKAGT